MSYFNWELDLPFVPKLGIFFCVLSFNKRLHNEALCISFLWIFLTLPDSAFSLQHNSRNISAVPSFTAFFYFSLLSYLNIVFPDSTDTTQQLVMVFLVSVGTTFLTEHQVAVHSCQLSKIVHCTFPLGCETFWFYSWKLHNTGRV